MIVQGVGGTGMQGQSRGEIIEGLLVAMLIVEGDAARAATVKGCSVIERIFRFKA
jgi:hypothetical protein